MKAGVFVLVSLAAKIVSATVPHTLSVFMFGISYSCATCGGDFVMTMLRRYKLGAIYMGAPCFKPSSWAPLVATR